MAVLTGKVKDMREITGQYKEGKRKGEEWKFLTMTIIDTSTGFAWSCQLPDEDEQYEQVQAESLVGHKVKVKVTSQTASERELKDKSKVMQIRSQITNVRDLGRPTDDDE